MLEAKILATFPKCPDCGSQDTIANLAVKPLRDAGKLKPDDFASLRKEVIPLEQPMLAAVAVPCIVTSFDVCLGCGRERATRAEILMTPIQMQAGGNHGSARAHN